MNFRFKSIRQSFKLIRSIRRVIRIISTSKWFPWRTDCSSWFPGGSGNLEVHNFCAPVGCICLPAAYTWWMSPRHAPFNLSLPSRYILIWFAFSSSIQLVFTAHSSACRLSVDRLLVRLSRNFNATFNLMAISSKLTFYSGLSLTFFDGELFI